MAFAYANIGTARAFDGSPKHAVIVFPIAFSAMNAVILGLFIARVDVVNIPAAIASLSAVWA